MEGGPSLLLMRGAREEWIDPLTQPEQLSFWPEEEREIRLKAPGSEYPWAFHERYQYYKARCVHPAVAAVLAEEDVQRHNAEQRRRMAFLTPKLFIA